MEAAQRVIAAGRHKALHRDTGLTAQISHELIQRIAAIVAWHAGIPPKIRHRLEMNAAHPRNPFPGKPNQIAQIRIVDAGHHGGDQRHTDLQIRTDLNGPCLNLQKRSSSQKFIDRITGAVKLKKYNIQSCL